MGGWRLFLGWHAKHWSVSCFICEAPYPNMKIRPGKRPPLEKHIGVKAARFPSCAEQGMNNSSVDTIFFWMMDFFIISPPRICIWLFHDWRWKRFLRRFFAPFDSLDATRKMLQPRCLCLIFAGLMWSLICFKVMSMMSRSCWRQDTNYVGMSSSEWQRAALVIRPNFQ